MTIRYQAFVGLILLGIPAGAAVSSLWKQSQSPTTIRANRFEIVDSEGKTAGILESSDGGCRVALLGKNGSHVIELKSYSNGNSRISLFDGKGALRSNLSVTTEEVSTNPFLEFYGENSGGTMTLSVGRRAAMIHLSGHGKEHAYLRTGPGDIAEVNIGNSRRHRTIKP